MHSRCYACFTSHDTSCPCAFTTGLQVHISQLHAADCVQDIHNLPEGSLKLSLPAVHTLTFRQSVPVNLVPSVWAWYSC